MEYRFLGNSGFRVPVLGLGAATFGGKGSFYNAWGDVGEAAARRLVGICIDAGVTFFDTADFYSSGASESILGAVLEGRRADVILSTKISLRTGSGINDVGSSRHHLITGVEQCLRRLRTDYIDLLQLHQFDAMTPVDSVMATLDCLVRSGKVRYVGVSNFSGWQLMKSLSVADRYGYSRYVANQTYYSLVGRDYEWELMPLGLDQGIGAVVWSPLGWGRLTGKVRRGKPLPESSRLHQTAHHSPPVNGDLLYRVVDALDKVADETDKSVPQVALNWLIQRPTVSTVLIGARNEQQLLDNLGAVGWRLTEQQMHTLDAASCVTPPYPYCHYWNGHFTERSPPPVAPDPSLLVS